METFLVPVSTGPFAAEIFSGWGASATSNPRIPQMFGVPMPRQYKILQVGRCRCQTYWQSSQPLLWLIVSEHICCSNRPSFLLLCHPSKHLEVFYLFAKVVLLLRLLVLGYTLNHDADMPTCNHNSLTWSNFKLSCEIFVFQ